MPSSINNNITNGPYDYFLEESSEDENKYDLDDEYAKLRQSIEELYDECTDELTDPLNKKLYNYDGLETLTTSPLEDISPFQIKEVHICPYSVNTGGLYPFLEYVLVKNKTLSEEDDELHEEKELNFLHFPFFFGLNIMNTCKQVLQIILKRMDDIHYKGYLLEDGNLYVFFDTSVEKQERAVYKDEPLVDLPVAVIVFAVAFLDGARMNARVVVVTVRPEAIRPGPVTVTVIVGAGNNRAPAYNGLSLGWCGRLCPRLVRKRGHADPKHDARHQCYETWCFGCNPTKITLRI